MAFSKPLLTDAQVQAFQPNTSEQGKVVQASRLVPILVDLSSEITLGKAILTAIHATAALHAVFGNRTQEQILAGITALSFVEPSAAVALKAYSGATTHTRDAPAGSFTYLPAVQLWKSYVEGSASEVIDVLTEL